MSSLIDKHVLILGGSSGIGLATAQIADAADACVTIASRTAKTREAALLTLSDKASGGYVDFSKLQTIDALFESIPAVDHLVFLPAAGALQLFQETSLETLRTHFEHSFFAAWKTLQVALPKLSEDGSITLITGALSRSPKPACSHIVAAQWATEGLMRGLIHEIAPKRMNIIAPGLVDTPFWDLLGPQDKAKLFENTSKDIPVGSPAQAEEIAEMIIATMTNRFMNGATLVNDGGWSC